MKGKREVGDGEGKKKMRTWRSLGHVLLRPWDLDPSLRSFCCESRDKSVTIPVEPVVSSIPSDGAPSHPRDRVLLSAVLDLQPNIVDVDWSRSVVCCCCVSSRVTWFE